MREMQDRILEVCCVCFALLAPMAGFAAERRAPQPAQIREWLRASIENPVRCVPSPKPGPASRAVAHEQKTVLGWSVAEKAWRPVKRHPEKVRDEDAE